MPRFAALCLPELAVDLVRRDELRRAPAEARRALLLIERHGSASRVVAACSRARGAGVRAGMSAAEASSFFAPGEARQIEHRPERDRAALARLAEWAAWVSPLVAPDPPDGVWIDLSGTARLFPEEGRLLARLVGALGRAGIGARAVIASAYGCAWALARFGRRERAAVPPGAERAALESLPIEGLRLVPEAEAALEEVGVTRIGELLALSREELATRFGAHVLLRIDRALGRAAEPFAPLRPRPRFEAARAFAGPTDSLEVLRAGVDELARELGQALAARARGATALELELRRSDLAPLAIARSLARPSRDARHFAALLWPGLERAELGFGVEGLRLAAPRTARLEGRQLGCAEPAGGESELLEREAAELEDVLLARLGPARLLRVESVESHIPERAFQARSVESARAFQARSVETVRASRASPMEPAHAFQACAGGGGGGARPTRLFATPEPVEVALLAPSGSPGALLWRGARVRVVGARGPERIGPEWWRGAAPGPTREYWAVEDEGGRWLWLFRELEGGRWFAHGEWA